MRCHVCSRELKDIMYKCFQTHGVSPIICLDCVKNKKEEINLKLAIRLMFQLNRLLLRLCCDCRCCEGFLTRDYLSEIIEESSNGFGLRIL